MEAEKVAVPSSSSSKEVQNTKVSGPKEVDNGLLTMGAENAAPSELYAGKDYIDPEPEPLYHGPELRKWSLWRATIAEFVATLLFVYISISTAIGNGRHAESGDGAGVGTLGVAWSFGATIFVLVYCTAGVSGGHINPAVTVGLLWGRRLTGTRAILYIIAQVLGATVGAGIVKGFQVTPYENLQGGANFVAHGYSKGTGLAAEIIGTFVLVYVVYSATDPQRIARDSHIPVLAPLPIGLAVFVVHLATIPITGTGINPARSFGAAAAWNHDRAWDDMWIFWVGPLIGASLAAGYHLFVLRALPVTLVISGSLSSSLSKQKSKKFNADPVVE